MIRLAVVGLGKMGLSHLAMINAHPDIEVVAIVDSTGYVLDVLQKYTGLKTFKDYQAMLDSTALDAVLIATPTRFHAAMVRAALDKGLNVFCEKPLTLTSEESEELAALAAAKGLVTQVGYHNRFVGAFREVKALLEAGAIGRVTHILAEAYGPVVLKSKGSTWRSQRDEGGGCLYDYAAHPVDLLSWYVGAPIGVGGTVLGSIFSENTEDEVFSTLYYPGNVSAQLSVNWSDESYRKMTTRITITGTAGRIHADRQEVQVYLRESAPVVPGYEKGWNVRYTTELTENVWFYLRGEEYSAQLAHFARRIQSPGAESINDFSSAAITDRVLQLLTTDAEAGPATVDSDSLVLAGAARVAKRGFLGRRS
jgi:predicted dehydrogenase